MSVSLTTKETSSLNEYSYWCRPLAIGVLTSLIVGLLLDMLGIGLGFSLFSPARSPLCPLTLGMVVWLFLVSIGSHYAGGWMAGYFSAATSWKTGVFYGSLVSFISIAILILLTLSTLGTIVNSSLSGLQTLSSLSSSVLQEGSMVGKLSKEMAKISPELSDQLKSAFPGLKPILEEINQKATKLLASSDQPSLENNPSSTERPVMTKTEVKKLVSLVSHYLKSLGESGNEKAKEELINTLTEASGRPRAEISQALEEWQKLYLEAKDKAHQATIDFSKNLAKKISQLAFLNFFLLLSAILAAILGSIYGVNCKIMSNKQENRP